MVKTNTSDHLPIFVIAIVYISVFAFSFYIAGRQDICGLVSVFEGRFRSTEHIKYQLIAVFAALSIWFLFSGLFHDFLLGKRIGSYWVLQDHQQRKFSSPALLFQYLSSPVRFYVIYPSCLFFSVMLTLALFRCL